MSGRSNLDPMAELLYTLMHHYADASESVDIGMVVEECLSNASPELKAKGYQVTADLARIEQRAR